MKALQRLLPQRGCNGTSMVRRWLGVTLATFKSGTWYLRVGLHYVDPGPLRIPGNKAWDHWKIRDDKRKSDLADEDAFEDMADARDFAADHD